MDVRPGSTMLIPNHGVVVFAKAHNGLCGPLSQSRDPSLLRSFLRVTFPFESNSVPPYSVFRKEDNEAPQFAQFSTVIFLDLASLFH